MFNVKLIQDNAYYSQSELSDKKQFLLRGKDGNYSRVSHDRDLFDQDGEKYHIGWTTIPKWMRKFGISMPNEAPVQIPMSEETKKPEKKDTVEALEARLQELQAELDREKLKNLALNTMIEVAEEELQIDIRKKPGAKQ